MVLAALSVPPQESSAHFERVLTSSRTVSLGGAFTGIADDPSALTYNPAGLPSISGYSFLSTLISPYGISDLQEGYFAAVLPAVIGKAGIAWHRLSIQGTTSEDLISIGFGRDYIRTSQDASLSFGGTLDIARVSYGRPYDTSQTVITGSLGVLLRPFPIIGIGYCVHNVVPRTFAFLPGSGGTGLKRTHTWSLAYHWNQQVSIVFDRQRDQGRIWSNMMGVEIKVLPGFMLRSGVNGGNVTGGAGFLIANMNVDVGVNSHEMMGVSYVISLGYSFSPASGNAYEAQ